MFRLAYNTNGLAHHRLLDALRLVADLGYEGVAITPDVGQLDPLDLDRRLVEDVRRWSDELGLDLALETGARFVLDPRRKHFPTLIERDPADRARRVDFLCRTVDLAVELGADVVSLWSGTAPDGATAESGAPHEAHWTHLVDGLRAVLDHAGVRGVNLAFEPEPGMFVERPAGYLELARRLGEDGDSLGLCLDVGHLLVTGDTPVPERIRELAPRLVHVHLDDIAGSVHEHRMFGEGELDLPATLAALLEVGYSGLAAVELSRDSHRGAWAAEEALRWIRESLNRRG
ncbi:MAG TPA: sugar phosphate isomerase/epimerase [Planctomycetota bacterium]|nr:sugar phosphate isomerase/epimerase [Planctomycetota bacterium]